MNSATKIHLSERELEMVIDSEWILTKHIIIKKVIELFGEILEEMKETVSGSFFSKNNALFRNGKISKGENYQGLPYVILDYPNIFSRSDIFAVRCMFWWGNFFSITLHVKGRYTNNSAITRDIIQYLKVNDLLICINDDEWQHHFEEDNYVYCNEINDERLHHLFQKDFIKISKKISLEEWSNTLEFFRENFKVLIACPVINFPACEKDPLPELPKDGSGL